MIPVGQQGAECGDEGQRLVENQMMVRIGNGDHWSVPIHQLVHVLRGVWGHRNRVLATEERHPTLHAGELIPQ